MVSTLVLIYFGRPPLGRTIIKTNFITVQIVDPEICSNLIFIKGSGTSSSTKFCICFFIKSIFRVIFY